MRIILVDDHPLYLDAASHQLSRAFPDAEIVTLSTLEDAVAALSMQDADLVMLDYSLPGGKGTEGVALIVEKAGRTPVIVMSGVASARDINACIEAGARGYLPKSMESQVFTDAVSVVLHGGTYCPAEFVVALRATAPRPHEAEVFATFSRREREVLRLLASGASNKEIAGALGILEVTVKSYLTRLFARMGVKNRSQAAVLVARMALPSEE